MIIAIIFGLIGLLLIFFEFFLPGGILGICGGFLVVAGFLIVCLEEPLFNIFIFLISVLVALSIVIRVALKKLKQNPPFFLSNDQSEYVASSSDPKLIGRTGFAKTDLKPSGHIEIETHSYQAVSESSYIKKGEKIKVVGVSGSCYKVRIATLNAASPQSETLQ